MEGKILQSQQQGQYYYCALTTNPIKRKLKKKSPRYAIKRHSRREWEVERSNTSTNEGLRKIRNSHEPMKSKTKATKKYHDDKSDDFIASTFISRETEFLQLPQIMKDLKKLPLRTFTPCSIVNSDMNALLLNRDDSNSESSLYANLLSRDYLQMNNKENVQRFLKMNEYHSRKEPWLEVANDEYHFDKDDDEMSFTESIFGESRRDSPQDESFERSNEHKSEHNFTIQLLKPRILFDSDDTSSQSSVLSFDPDDFQEDASIEDIGDDIHFNLCTILEEEGDDAD